MEPFCHVPYMCSAFMHGDNVTIYRKSSTQSCTNSVVSTRSCITTSYALIMIYWQKEVLNLQYKLLYFYTDHDGSVSMPEDPERQESDDTMTKTPTPPPATGSFSSLQFRSLQTTPIVGPRSQVINLSSYFPRVSSDPTSRKRYHTAPREKHRVRKQRFVNWSVFRHFELSQPYCGSVTRNFILSS